MIGNSATTWKRSLRGASIHLIPAIISLVGVTELAAQALPVSGTPDPRLAVFDQAMVDFMNLYTIEAGLLGVMFNGTIVLQRGYGWKDADHVTSLPDNAMMRIASLTKPITAAAIRKPPAGHSS